MAGLTIGWEYLTGKCVATDPSNRRRAEWPPHPGRVFMALAATWFETGEVPEQGEALRWLEKQGDPSMVLPPRSEISHRKVVDVYVPVNDQSDPFDRQNKTVHMNLSSVAFGRARQPRTFPSVWVGESRCYLHWRNASEAGLKKHHEALSKLCGEVTRIGHSSSLVRMWLAEELALNPAAESWLPDDALAELQTRQVAEGTLTLLDRQFNGQGRENHTQLSERISVLRAEKPTGKGAKERKTAIKSELEKLQEAVAKIDGREPVRPKLGLWTGYRCAAADPPASVPHTKFDSDLLILSQVHGPRLPLVSTLTVTQSLRRAVIRHSAVQQPPSWVSGHLEDSQPLRDDQQHLAFIPLPFVGHAHADGRLLGTALVFPRTVPRPERGRVLRQLLVSEKGEARKIELTLGRLGVWTLRKRDSMEHRQTLLPETWTASPTGATTWATVTPVVLDRFPKRDPYKERDAWQSEVAGSITTACVRLGLPAPISVAIGTTGWHRGSPRATEKRRRLRGHPEMPTATASLGDGFPTYPTKGANGARPQLHVCLQFAEPVIGPILLCAGRFLGYGLCKPLWGGADR